MQRADVTDVKNVHDRALEALDSAQKLINRSYLADLGRYPVLPFEQAGVAFNRASDTRIFHIERIVQNNAQSVLESTTAAYTALGAAGYSVFLLLDSNGLNTDLYIGTRGEPGQTVGHNSGELLRETFKGHFPGSPLRPLGLERINTLLDALDEAGKAPATCVTAVTGVPALSTDNRDHFMQGLERFIDAAEGRPYQALILAEPLSSRTLDVIRTGYEQVATQLWPLMKQQLSFGEQASDSVGLSLSTALSESLGDSLGLTETRGTSTTHTTSQTDASTTTESTTSQSALGKLAKFGAGLPGPVGLVAKAALMFDESHMTGSSQSTAHGISDSGSSNHSEASSRTSSTTHTSSATDTQSKTLTQGTSKQITIEAVDKTIEQMLGRVDHHLARIDEAKTYGGWNTAAYFIAGGAAASESLASIFLGLIRGSKSSHEDFALTTWGDASKRTILQWLATLTHPLLQPDFASQVPIRALTPATLVSGKELAIQLSLPRRSTSSVAVVETQAFGRKVQYLDGTSATPSGQRTLRLGQLRHLWENLPQPIDVGLDQLTGHLFVSGATGSGKSNTLYEILRQLHAAKVHFLVIEPAKGEYKHVFGHWEDVRVLGTNPGYSELLKINPFSFPDGIHVLEHIDQLIEIFTVCWPMYAAMPAVLKQATLLAYERCGWNLDNSVNSDMQTLFPTFADLLVALEQVIDASAYSQEVKSNYVGSLATRVSSLANGLNGQMFNADELPNEELFEANVIVDMSRVASSETKALIMGVLVMRLSEYRIAKGGMNMPLRHVTVLEEAHNILRGHSRSAQGEGPGVESKAVEMLTNAIAQMRTYGEGFIIADQSPQAVDVAAIRNTNTKIIMRLADEADRRLLGKSVGLRDEQLEEIARLPSGVAVVYQNNWLEPVLCQVRKFDGMPTVYKPALTANQPKAKGIGAVLTLLLAHRVDTPQTLDESLLETTIPTLSLPTPMKADLIRALRAAQVNGQSAWASEQPFESLAALVVELLHARSWVGDAVRVAVKLADLTQQLRERLHAFTEGLDTALALAALQCLMKHYSLQNAAHQPLYVAWRHEIEKEYRS